MRVGLVPALQRFKRPDALVLALVLVHTINLVRRGGGGGGGQRRRYRRRSDEVRLARANGVPAKLEQRANCACVRAGLFVIV